MYSIFMPPVERDQRLSGDRELDHEHGAFLAGRVVRNVALNVRDLRIRNERDVEFRGFLGIAVEPHAGNDL
ncbi:hypothetical protein ACVWWG_004813 [Bradyrhizobium sp. LB7.2]